MRTNEHMLAESIGPLVSWPTHLHSIADALEAKHKNFNREKFLRRAEDCWYQNHEIKEIDDEIPY